jgi:predicted  nucleic acid-binding Zn-ribbon protein
MKKKVPKKEVAKVFTSDEVMSLLEHMSDGIEVIAEVQSGTNKRIDGLEQRFDGLENKFEGFERKFDRLEQKVDRLQDDMTDVKQALSVKVDRTEFSKWEKRIVKVERVVFDGAKVR